ncbi:hypothetical protein D3C72_2289540 [compost metagenome]
MRPLFTDQTYVSQLAAISVPLRARIARRFGLSRSSRHQPGCFQTSSNRLPNSADQIAR